ncbi:MAG: hypothetical protein MUD01_06585 [Chloroflexaceae bacterium]|jgi:hypothetical protein|nr:hypothetical protein [Chloroflexaceae bacterium]
MELRQPIPARDTPNDVFERIQRRLTLLTQQVAAAAAAYQGRGPVAEDGQLIGLSGQEPGAENLTSYPVALVEQLLAAEATWQQTLRSLISQLQAEEEAASLRYAAAWQHWYALQANPADESVLIQQQRAWAYAAQQLQVTGYKSRVSRGGC